MFLSRKPSVGDECADKNEERVRSWKFLHRVWRLILFMETLRPFVFKNQIVNCTNLSCLLGNAGQSAARRSAILGMVTGLEPL